MKKLQLHEGSHPINKELNEELFDELNTLLVDDVNNPYHKEFQEELYFLDSTDGMISIANHVCNDEFLPTDHTDFYEYIKSIFINDHILKYLYIN